MTHENTKCTQTVTHLQEAECELRAFGLERWHAREKGGENKLWREHLHTLQLLDVALAFEVVVVVIVRLGAPVGSGGVALGAEQVEPEQVRVLVSTC